jgi:transposase
MKSNYPLWKKHDPVELERDLRSLSASDLMTKYQCSRKSIFTACDHFGTDKTRISGKELKYICPPKDVLIEQLHKGKQHVANLYGCTIPVVNLWIEKLGIEVARYHGRLAKVDTQQLQNLVDRGMTDRHIAEELGISPAAARRAGERNGIVVPRKADEWKIQREFLTSKLLWVVEQNRTRDILDISRELKITHSTVLKFVKESGYDVVMHSHNKSRGEIELKEFVQSLGVDAKSVKRTFNGTTFEIDCFVDSHKLGIEYCGEYWHSDAVLDKMYHHNKRVWCKDQGIHLITLFEHEWRTKRDIVESMIRNRLGVGSTRLYARKCTVRIISTREANTALNLWHIQGGLKTSTVAVGLFYGGRIVSVMTFVRPRFSTKVQWEIGRLASALDTVVVGGASKMFQHFVSHQAPETCGTYCDLRFGEGGVYQTLGFSLDTTSPPGYFYYHQPTGMIRSRYSMQKHKMSTSLDVFDPQKTEYENAVANRFLRVWDCGNNVFVWKSSNDTKPQSIHTPMGHSFA